MNSGRNFANSNPQFPWLHTCGSLSLSRSRALPPRPHVTLIDSRAPPLSFPPTFPSTVPISASRSFPLAGFSVPRLLQEQFLTEPGRTRLAEEGWEGPEGRRWKQQRWKQVEWEGRGNRREAACPVLRRHRLRGGCVSTPRWAPRMRLADAGLLLPLPAVRAHVARRLGALVPRPPRAGRGPRWLAPECETAC